MPAKPKLRLVKPTTQKRAVALRRRPNSEFRSREHLTETEVEKLIEAAKDNRYASYHYQLLVQSRQRRADFGGLVSRSRL